MKIKIEINCDNAAFDESLSIETISILSKLAEKLTHTNIFDVAILRDSNGNAVGTFEVVE